MIQGPHEEMEDDVLIVQSDDPDGFTYAAVFDGHACFSSVKFLRLESCEKEDESGSTAIALFVGNDTLIIAHVGDSSVVLSRSGKAEVLTNSHRPYGNNKVSLQETRNINEAGGWIVNGRICGEISASRAFGDIRFKTKKKEMLEKGVKEGRWSEKFISRSGETWLQHLPDVLQVTLGSDAEFVLLASDGLWDYMKRSGEKDYQIL